MFLVTFLLYDNQAVCVTENSDVSQYLSDYFPQSTFYLFCFLLPLRTEGWCSLKHLVSAKGHYQAQGGSPACHTPVASSWAILLRTQQPFHPSDTAFFFLGHKIEGFHGTKLRRNQVQGWDTKADNKGWPHPIKGLRGKVNQKKIKPRIKVNILTSNMTAPTLSYTKGQCAKAAFEGSLVWVPLSSGKSWLCLTLKPSDLRMWVTGYSLKCITSCIKQIQSWSPNIS